MRKYIHTEKGAPPRGPYSQAVVASGPLVFISSQGAIDPATGEPITGSFREKAEQVFQNITTLLEAAETSWENVVKIGVFLDDMDNFAEMNEVYLQYVKEPYPARTTAQSNLGERALVVDCVAALD